MNVTDSVAREKKGVKAGEEREVRERGEVVIREINCILILRRISTDHTAEVGLPKAAQREKSAIKSPGRASRTFAIPKFSMAGILCPTRVATISIQLLFQDVVPVLFRWVCSR